MKILVRRYLPLMLAALLMISATGCGLVNEDNVKMAPQKTTVFTKNNQQKLSNFNIGLKIPVIKGMQDQKRQTDLNQMIEKEQTNRIQSMQKDLDEYVAGAKENNYPVNSFDIASDYKVPYNKDNILSIVVTIYQYSGGAHGYTDQIAYNIDLETGKILTIKDLFKPGAKFIPVINKEIKKQIEAKPDEFFMDEGMGFKTITNSQPFYFVDDGIMVYFGLYEIAPYASGIKEFKIPASLVKNDLQNRYI